MMLARGNVPVPRKMFVEDFAVPHLSNIEPAPSRNAAAALATNLPRKQPRRLLLDAVIVRLDDPFFALVFESDQPLAFNCAVKQIVQFRIAYDSDHHPLFPDESLRQQTPMFHLFSKVIGLLSILPRPRRN